MMPPIGIGIFLCFGALIFAAQIVVAIQTGTAKLPITLLEYEERDRDENAAGFWGITFLNGAIALTFLGFAINQFVSG